MMKKEEQNGYCPTCKQPQPRIQLCDRCVGLREGGGKINDDIPDPPKVTQRPWKDYGEQ